MRLAVLIASGAVGVGVGEHHPDDDERDEHRRTQPRGAADSKSDSSGYVTLTFTLLRVLTGHSRYTDSGRTEPGEYLAVVARYTTDQRSSYEGGSRAQAIDDQDLRRHRRRTLAGSDGWTATVGRYRNRSGDTGASVRQARSRRPLMSRCHNDLVAASRSAPFSWRRAFAFGVPFGILMGFFDAFTNHRDSPVAVLIVAALSGVVFGTLMAWLPRQQLRAWQQRTSALTEGLSQEERTAALIASLRGPLPTDLRIREAAAAITHYRLALMNRQTTKNSLVIAAFMVLSILMAVFSSAWWWLAFLLFTFFQAMDWWQLRRLQHWLALLAH